MTQDKSSQFKAKIRCPQETGSDSAWAFIVLPRDASAKLPRRGRTTVEGTINGQSFKALLEPDGQKSHWLKIDEELMKDSGTRIGDIAQFKIMPVEHEPEPEVPDDFGRALKSCPEAWATWNSTTTLARVDWIHWITSARQTKTRAKRIHDACDMLLSGKKRVCCFDPSGVYSKALSAPDAADQ
ncbi:MAG TPA: YdeI/OmpD-associated family protein [Woeseiaceae bacterium]|nr:YdeI/OmpD-associated family protein [Woeseiaceae bacterium]